MATKRRRLCKTGVIREAGGLKLLIYNLQLLCSGKRCVSLIDVSSCYLPPDIEDSPVSGGAGEEEDFRSKFFLTSTHFSHHMASYCPVG